MNREQLKQLSLDGITAWAESQPWCQAMADCAQDAKWHSEGDVWTHTKMVLGQLLKLEEWPALTPHEQTLLIFTAMFHDVAKPLMTEVDSETGRFRSPKHAVKGEQVARNLLRDRRCDLTTREEIARLVRYHGRPAFLLERSEPSHEFVWLSWLVSNRLLSLFALADTRGRTTDAMTRPEENLHYWKLLAEESGCYSQPYPFATNHARFTVFRQPEPNLYNIPHAECAGTVTLMAGLPGSGKDTWLARNRSDLPVVLRSGIRGELEIDDNDNQGAVAQLAKERCRDLIRARTSFAFNATNTMRQTRGRWLDLFDTDYARIETMDLEPPFENLLRQHRACSRAVPKPVVRKLADQCEPPTWIECHELLIRDGSTDH